MIKTPGIISLENIQKVTRVLYHSPCSDGFGGAYCFWKLLGEENVEYIPVSHSTPKEVTLEKIKDLKGHGVVFVDFCYKQDIMMEIYNIVDYLLILDHHKTTVGELNADLQEHAVIDMERSGTMLAWDFCFQGQDRPRFLEYIGDRDLWKWQHDETDPFTTIFYNEVPFEFEEYQKYEDNELVEKTIQKGKVVLEYERKQIENAAEHAVSVNFLGHNVMLSNSTVHASKLGNKLAVIENVDFAMIWHYDHKRKSIKVSLRSTPTTTDVSEIAKRFGGGGHRCASGFTWKGDSIERLLVSDKWYVQRHPYRVTGSLITAILLGGSYLLYNRYSK